MGNWSTVSLPPLVVVYFATPVLTAHAHTDEYAKEQRAADQAAAQALPANVKNVRSETVSPPHSLIGLAKVQHADLSSLILYDILVLLSGLQTTHTQFITSLKSALLSGNVGQLHGLYTTSFPRLTQEHYSQVEWPEVEVASILADGNEVFAIFYKELYYR